MRASTPVKQVAGVRRAKMFIRRDLHWLVGFPTPQGLWNTVPSGDTPAETFQIGRKHLRQATFTVNKLIREFPRALPVIVGDVEKWGRYHRTLIEAFKPTVHDGKPLSSSALELHPEYGADLRKTAEKIRRETPSLAATVDAISWLTWLEPKRFRSALNWLEANQSLASGIVNNLGHELGRVTLAHLSRLSTTHRPAQLRPCMEWLADTRVHTMPMRGGRSFVDGASASLKHEDVPLPPRPEAEIGTEMAGWVDWLARQNVQTSRRSLELFSLVCDESVISDWEDWWKSVDEAVRESAAIPQPHRRRHPLTKKLKRARQKMRELATNTPPSIPAVLFFLNLKDEFCTVDASRYSHIRRALRALPMIHEGVVLRFAFLNHWGNLWRQEEFCEQEGVVDLISALGRLSDAHADTGYALNPWRSIWQQYSNDDWRRPLTSDYEILHDLNPRQFDSFFGSLKALLQETTTPLDVRDLHWLVDLTTVLTPERLADSLIQLKDRKLTGYHVSNTTLKLAGTITRSNPQRFGAVVEAFDKANGRYDDPGRLLAPVVRMFTSDEDLEGLLIDIILNGQFDLLYKAALKISIIENQGDQVPTVAAPKKEVETPDWIDAYPSGLSQALMELASVDDHPEKTARRVLSKDLPDRSKLTREIDALNSRIARGGSDDANLTTRLQNLETRRNEGSRVSEQRLEKLAEKVRRSTLSALLERWTTEIDAAFRDSLPAFLDHQDFPEWGENPDHLALLGPIMHLDRPFQKLALRLLQSRSEPSPWDLRDHPANQRFIQQLSRQGLIMEPWVDGADTLTARSRRGDDITFSLERDPLEVFNMGAPFGTCLSPDNINFFSAIVNAADINKQVLYGRDSRGIVVARALMALTDEGGILTFYPYSHEKELGFQEIVQRFAHKLAEEMGTLVVADGEVSKLVGSDWYDDGPVDLTRQFESLADGSAFREELSALRPKDFVPAMEQAVAPLPLNGLTLPLFINLPEMENRPELVNALFPIVERCERLSPYSLVRMTILLAEAGCNREVERLVPRLVKLALAADSNHRYIPRGIVETLSKVAPSKALRVLRNTRPYHGDSWDDEWNGDRIAWGAYATLRLNRPKQALKLFRLAVQHNLSEELEEYCQQQIQEIERPDATNSCLAPPFEWKPGEDW